MKKLFVLGLMSMLFVFPVASQVNAQWFLFENPMVGKSAENFSLPNLSGKKQSLKMLREDDAAIIFFWATWCPHCRTNLAKLNKNLDAINEKGIRIVLVDLGESSSAVKKYLKRNNMDFNVLLDQQGDVAGKYGVQGIPTFIYINADGIVKAIEHELVNNYEKVLEI